MYESIDRVIISVVQIYQPQHKTKITKKMMCHGDNIKNSVQDYLKFHFSI